MNGIKLFKNSLIYHSIFIIFNLEPIVYIFFLIIDFFEGRKLDIDQD